MKPNNRRVDRLTRVARLLTCALVIAGGLAGCAVKKPVTDPAMDKKAGALAVKAREFNSAITTSKGTGRLELTGGGRKESFRIAWAAKAPDRLRLTLMASGHPVETIAADGKKVTFISHTGRHSPHTTLSADPDLDAYIGVPVHLSEMVAILLGRIPAREFDRAWMVPGRERVIHTNKRYGSRIQELAVDDRDRISHSRLLDRSRALIFGMEISTWSEKNGFDLPRDLAPMTHRAAPFIFPCQACGPMPL